MKKIHIYCLFLLGFFVMISCSNEDDNKKGDYNNHEINEWILKTMKDNYLWYQEIEDKPDSYFNLGLEPDKFFKSLLSDKDGKVFHEGGEHIHFSDIEKKRSETKAISEVDPTYGFEYIIYNVTNLGCYYFRIVYVLPESPAAEIGLKRDDFIIGINGGENNIKDNTILEKADQLPILVGVVDYDRQRIVKKGEYKLPAGRIMDNNPFLKDSVYDINGKKIGYLVYNHFSAQAEGENNSAYDNQMKTIFADFKSQGVNEFVLDLRFNGGGLVSSSLLLSSLLAPSADLGKTYCKLIYNDKKSNYDKTLPLDKAVTSSNLNLKRLYVLTGQWTASASEAVINGLRPYMEVEIIGDETVGKAVGSNPFGEKENYGWIMHPITLKICNAQGNADYSQVGFTPSPNNYIYEYDSDPFIKLYELGDTREILLSMAIERINGITNNPLRSYSVPSSESLRMEPVSSSLDKKTQKGFILEDMYQ